MESTASSLLTELRKYVLDIESKNSLLVEQLHVAEEKIRILTNHLDLNDLADDPQSAAEEEEESLSDWEEENDEKVVDLFSDRVFDSCEELAQSLIAEHGLDLVALQKQHGYEFYDLIKIINFARFSYLMDHKLPVQIVSDIVTNPHMWMDSEIYLKPVIPQDPFLCYVEHVESNGSDDESQTPRQQRPVKKTQTDPDASVERGNDDSYFESYARIGIHEEMLKDAARTEAYRDAVLNNPSTFRNKVVLDLGCGTGILSMFCAKAGSKLVIALDNSAIIDSAARLAEANGFSRSHILFVRAKVEDMDHLPSSIDPREDQRQVDVIISEWMGYALLYESMLNSVICARDKWLKRGGRVFPNLASLYIEAVSDLKGHENRYSWWKNVYGFDFSGLPRELLDEREAVVDFVDGSKIVSNRVLLKEIDIEAVSVSELNFSSQISLQPRQLPVKVTGFCLSFDVSFICENARDTVLSTSTTSKPTHWKQTLLWLRTPIECLQSDVQLNVSFSRHDRDLDIVLEIPGLLRPSLYQVR